MTDHKGSGGVTGLGKNKTHRSREKVTHLQDPQPHLLDAHAIVTSTFGTQMLQTYMTKVGMESPACFELVSRLRILTFAVVTDHSCCVILLPRCIILNGTWP